ncbi:A-type potassium channel modulatory protein DPP6-like isoform X2 [Centruroides vittatus]|uniref:A-type potassium channel modulatory protein DPP6-like isoform X2 n=1 Tax=Centruroides vittatus TaxID=120091 RepID=UPI0035100F45
MGEDIQKDKSISQSEMDALLLGRTKELVSADPDQRNWRGICIALLVIAIVCSLIVTAIFLLTPGFENPRVINPRFTLEEIISGDLEPRYFNGTWISGEELVFRDFYGNLVVYNVEKRDKTILMPNPTFKRLNAFHYKISSDKKYIILTPQFTKVYKYSYTANYIIYDLINQTEYRVPNNGNNSAFLNEKLQFVSWGPKGNQFIYVQNNNIFYLQKIKQSKPWQITNSESDGLVYNGIPDWLYEHEIFRSNKALWWSKDGTKLCYATFNDTLIKPFEYTLYGSFENINNIYPSLAGIRYPKAGTKIPKVTLFVALLRKEKFVTKQITPPKEYSNIEYYVTSVKWIDNESLSINWLARWQNTSIISTCSEKSNWSCKKILQVDSSGEGWVETNEAPLFTSDKRHCFLRHPVADGEAGDFWHVAKINVENGRKDFLTHGKFDVTRIAAYDEENNTVYIVTTLLNKPGERHLVRVREGEISGWEEECLTCNLDEQCLYNDVEFSPSGKYYILQCLGPGLPKTEIRQTYDNFLVKVLDRNDNFRDILRNRAFPQIRTFQVPLKDDYNANVRMFLPPGLRDDEIIKYPLIINIDGSPGSQTVSEKFQLHWGIYLASKKNFLYVWIDGRGSGFQGNKRLHQVYGQLGIVEVEDYITVTRYLKDHLLFVNGDNIVIWGWGYGGYASALALIKEETVFDCAISVAPVTNWVYHDAFYAERYMKMPKSSGNLIGYEKTDISRKAHRFKGKKFLLIHGTADEFIHLQHSMVLMKALSREGVTFRSQLYPDENHDLKNVRKHFYWSMEEFLLQCFHIDSSVSSKSNR